ncbi:hypothetical protein TNCV_4373281 [Trichonephila clavipes]|uniref:DUF4817 domain-containing protein n=1 Tax=Trichonephila clavipes TaxID=2585209 RepID=A0A8X6R3S1_TRICX|nr:hypothetical protein TNCV_4373281 [Trichonephila clavipes]
MMFFQERRIAIVKFYLAAVSHCHVIKVFQQKYSSETALNASTLTFSVRRFCNTGSVPDRKRSGRVSIVKTKVADMETDLQRKEVN